MLVSTALCRRDHDGKLVVTAEKVLRWHHDGEGEQQRIFVLYKGTIYTVEGNALFPYIITE